MRSRNPERFEASLPLALQAALTRRASSRGINRTALVREILTLAVMSESEPEAKTHPLAKITGQLDQLANAVAKLEGLSSAVAQAQALSKQSLLLSAAAVTSVSLLKIPTLQPGEDGASAIRAHMQEALSNGKTLLASETFARAASAL